MEGAPRSHDYSVKAHSGDADRRGEYWHVPIGMLTPTNSPFWSAGPTASTVFPSTMPSAIASMIHTTRKRSRNDRPRSGGRLSSSATTVSMCLSSSQLHGPDVSLTRCRRRIALASILSACFECFFFVDIFGCYAWFLGRIHVEADVCVLATYVVDISHIHIGSMASIYLCLAIDFHQSGVASDILDCQAASIFCWQKNITRAVSDCRHRCIQNPIHMG